MTSATVGSRLGVKVSSDLGNGLTTNGKYEFGTTSNNSDSALDSTRVATVGLSGSFGRMDVSNQWSSYFNAFGTLISPTYTLGYFLYSSVGGAPYRASNTIKYSNTFGPLYAELDVRLNDSEEGTDVAEGINGNGIGLAAKGNFGGYWVSLGWQNYETDDLAEITVTDDATLANGGIGGTDSNTDPDVVAPAKPGADIDTTFLYVGGNFSEKTNWLLGLSEADVTGQEALSDPEQFTWGVYHNLGGGLKLYYEATDVEIQAKNIDGARHLLGMRVDF